jgi:DNA-binding transcriptional MerR regulator
MSAAADERQVLSPGQVARMFGVDVKTLGRWEETKTFMPSFRTPGGTRRYYRDEVEAFIKGTRS